MSIAIAQGTPIPPPHAGAVLTSAFEANLGVGFTPASIGMNYVAQERDRWCWAACFEMIGAHLHLGAMSQLSMAKRVFGDAACSNPASNSCNRAAFPDQVVNLFGMTCSLLEQALNSQELGENLRYGPVQVGFENDTIGGTMSHVALIAGLNSNGTVDFLDPWPDFGQSSLTLAQLFSHYHWGPWKRSYVQFAAM